MAGKEAELEGSRPSAPALQATLSLVLQIPPYFQGAQAGAASGDNSPAAEFLLKQDALETTGLKST